MGVNQRLAQVQELLKRCDRLRRKHLFQEFLEDFLKLLLFKCAEHLSSIGEVSPLAQRVFNPELFQQLQLEQFYLRLVASDLLELVWVVAEGNDLSSLVSQANAENCPHLYLILTKIYVFFQILRDFNWHM